MHALSRSMKGDTRFLSVVFSGDVSLDERRRAFGTAVEAAIAGQTSNILIDFTDAHIAPYPVVDGVKYAWHAVQLAFLDKIAYVAPGNVEDLAIRLLRTAHDIDVRLFETRDDALAWLGETKADGTPAVARAHQGR